jgi:AraC-like DNA-binding protein
LRKIDIQSAIDWIDGNLENNPGLKDISAYIGYSEFHTSRAFKAYTGSTLKRYIMLRRLTKAAKDLRDLNVRIIDVAIRYGFQSQEAFSRSFKEIFGINPGQYQKNNKPIAYFLKKDILFPENLKERGEVLMVKDEEIKIRMEEIEAHKLVYIKRQGVDNYMDFWEMVDQEEGMDCDHLHGVFSSIPGIYPEGFGAFTKDGYLFGTDCSLDYDIKGYPFEEKIIPKQKYLIFEHPGFSEAEFGQALRQVRRVALEKFDFEMHGYDIDQSFVKAYEHSGMELLYYFIRIPLKEVKK